MKPILRMTTLLILAACSDGKAGTDTPAPIDGVTLRLEEVARGLSSPVHVTAPSGDPRVFIVEQTGRIRILENGTLRAEPFLDIRNKLTAGGERGLFSVAFHPDYATNGYFYVNYTDQAGDTRVERYRVSADRYRADAASARLILSVDQPYSNHNGGHILFGPDRMLYIAMGDGGSSGDPQRHGQNRSTLLGDLLRIDVDRGDPYSIPSTNPFVNMSSARGEIWAWGLRNPWRIAFDAETGLLYIADVGQRETEEINVVSATQRGLNFGWNIMEGGDCYDASSCDRSGLVLPVVEYNHPEGCSITGGLVYRGSRLPGLAGHYFYADYCGGWIRSFRYSNGRAEDRHEWFPAGTLSSITSFGSDASGDMYVLSGAGTVYRLGAASQPLSSR